MLETSFFCHRSKRKWLATSASKSHITDLENLELWSALWGSLCSWLWWKATHEVDTEDGEGFFFKKMRHAACGEKNYGLKIFLMAGSFIPQIQTKFFEAIKQQADHWDTGHTRPAPAPPWAHSPARSGHEACRRDVPEPLRCIPGLGQPHSVLKRRPGRCHMWCKPLAADKTRGIAHRRTNAFFSGITMWSLNGLWPFLSSVVAFAPKWNLRRNQRLVRADDCGAYFRVEADLSFRNRLKRSRKLAPE